MSTETDFEPIARDVNCPHCAAGDTAPIAGIDAIYCISLREQQPRADSAIAHFHRRGLCRAVTMYRPRRGVYTTRAIWRSHTAVARHALDSGHRRALIFEDDAEILLPAAQFAARVAEKLALVPPDWWCLYLGHVPFQAYEAAPGLLRTRSACTHAYIANLPLLRWLAWSEPMDPTVALRPLGDNFDAATANLPGMYAVDPMIVVQRRSDEMRPDTAADRRGKLSSRLRTAVEGWVIYDLMRPVGALVKLGAPFHRLTLERRRLHARRTQLEARIVRESGLFDDDWYLRRYPDVASQDRNPLFHFLAAGGREGRWPNPLFDAAYYLAAHPELKKFRINPLLHYVMRGAYEGHNPNAMFDSAWYLETYPEVARARLNPLAHFARTGWREGRNPSPEFDCAAYLAAHRDARDSGINPLAHYLSMQGR